MIRSKIAMGPLWVLLTLVLHVIPGVVVPTHAQGTRKDDIVFNSRGIPLAGATVRVCAMPATGQPCSPLALIYSDAAMTQALANPTTTDGLGNYFFYAAPGQYEIEISGPQIKTRQIPNVILPTDPSNPNFPGNISAFSLNLAGNLTVTGNTSVIGNLASGTLQLNNQGVPPTSSGSGTVNLYTKTVDKRLYYVDDTGSEIGPIGASSGAQTNIQNTFTAQQNFDADIHNKGPNQSYDTSRWGGYIGGFPTAPTTTGNISAGSATLTTPTSFDIVNGQYVTVYGAGPTATVLPPGSPVPVTAISVTSNVATVTQGQFWYIANGQSFTITGSSDSAFNGTFTATNNWGNQITFAVTHSNCSPCAIGTGAAYTLTTPVITGTSGTINNATTWTYKIVAEDLYGGLSAASPAVTVTGAATLGQNALTVASGGCSRDANGVSTITLSATSNIQAGTVVFIKPNTTGDTSFEGQFTTIATPTSTTFTYSQYGKPAVASSCTGGTVLVAAKNILQWNDKFYAGTTGFASPAGPKGYWIYRCASSCGTNSNFTLVGHSDGVDGRFTDYGIGAPAPPTYVPTNPPLSPTNQWLSAKVNSGGGTTTLTLNTSATNTVSGARVLHDNTPVIYAICAAMPSGGPTGVQGGTIYSPDGSGGAVMPFTTTLDMVSNCPGNLRWQFAARLSFLQPMIPNGAFTLEGLPQGGASSGTNGLVPTYQAQIMGSAYPLILVRGDKGREMEFLNANLSCVQPYQGCWIADPTFAGSNAIFWKNFGFNGAAGSFPLKLGAAFHFYWDKVQFGNQATPATWGVPEPVIFTVPSGIGQAANLSQTLVLPSISEMHEAIFTGGGMVFDAAGENPAAPALWRMFNVLCESCITPIVRLAFQGSTTVFTGFWFENLQYADFTGGQAAPLVDVASTSRASVITFQHPSCANGNQPLIAGSPAYGLQVSPSMSNNGCNAVGAPAYASPQSGNFPGMNIFTSGAGTFTYQMALPAAPASAVVSTGGAVPIGTHTYAIAGIDANGLVSSIGPSLSATTSSGNQTVTLTPPALPVGAVGYAVYRDGLFTQNFIGQCGTPTTVRGPGNYIDASASTCNSNFTLGVAATSSIGLTGVNGPQYQLTGGGFSSTVSGTFTTNRTVTQPDVSGYNVVSSYLNSAYDNTTRANGAIGSNWTVQQNGLNIASNQIQGTTGGASNSAFWNANPFAPMQFSQATITALNGTTDFPGVTVLASGSAGTSTYYDCVENSTTIFLQRVVNGATTNLTSTASAGAVGDVLRLEYSQGGSLACFKNGVSTLTASDTQIATGAPGMLISGNVAKLKNWTGGNLHPIGQLDVEADYTKVQHFNAGVGIGSETLSASPRAEQNIFLPGALTSTWTGSTWTLDKAVTITRLQVQAKTAPAGCATNAVVQLTDGTTPVNVTVSAAANDSGVLAQIYSAGASLQLTVQTAAAGCATSPADANVVVQYRMQ